MRFHRRAARAALWRANQPPGCAGHLHARLDEGASADDAVGAYHGFIHYHGIHAHHGIAADMAAMQHGAMPDMAIGLDHGILAGKPCMTQVSCGLAPSSRIKRPKSPRMTACGPI